MRKDRGRHVRADQELSSPRSTQQGAGSPWAVRTPHSSASAKAGDPAQLAGNAKPPIPRLRPRPAAAALRRHPRRRPARRLVRGHLRELHGAAAAGRSPCSTASRARYPMVMHGVSLSIALDCAVRRGLSRRPRGARRARASPNGSPITCAGPACTASTCTTCCPFPYTREALDHVVARVHHVQERSAARSCLENVSTYVQFNALRDARVGVHLPS